MNNPWLTEEVKRAARNDTQAVLPEDDDCTVCGIYIHTRALNHALICGHPLMQDLLATMKTGTRQGQLQQLLSKESVQTVIMQREKHLPPSMCDEKKNDKSEKSSSSSSETSSSGHHRLRPRKKVTVTARRRRAFNKIPAARGVRVEGVVEGVEGIVERVAGKVHAESREATRQSEKLWP